MRGEEYVAGLDPLCRREQGKGNFQLLCASNPEPTRIEGVREDC